MPDIGPTLHALIRAELDNPLRPLPAVILPETTLADLGADALDLVTLSMAIEDAFGIDIHDHELRADMTVGEVAYHCAPLFRSPRRCPKPHRKAVA